MSWGRGSPLNCHDKYVTIDYIVLYAGGARIGLPACVVRQESSEEEEEEADVLVIAYPIIL